MLGVSRPRLVAGPAPFRIRLAHMDWLTFFDHLIGHLAWPLVVAGLVVFLSLRHRAAIDALLHRVQKAKAGLFELELAQAKAEAEAAGLPSAAPSLPGTEKIELPERTRMLETSLDRTLALAATNPRQAILEAYAFLTAFLLTAANLPDMQERVRYTDGSPDMLSFAVTSLLAPEHAHVLDTLRDAALSATSDQEVSPQQAREYVQLVRRLLLAVAERLPTVQEQQAEQ
jgi:hypothetical protein